MESGKTLIDRASSICGSVNALAQRLGENQSFLNKMAHGQKGVSPAIAARLADIAGLDPRDAACAALLAKEKDPETRAELARLFGFPVDGPDWLHTKP
jgi:DNA-binding transcriptional regulator YdaS (Cro superfamily)